ncbi:hypothetical protein HK100_011392 [Physocladia obscura]|uniref:AAA+ ATPase domain-containing protein n=1 Tax=Physocladia obscura TaxID=109957 RepID=A0AAD5XIL8_9FUNG|nr:hypothetical protein HK100_011392 [Physocladia obscura]
MLTTVHRFQSIRHQPIRLQLATTTIRQFSAFGESRRLERLKAEAQSPGNSTNPTLHAEFYKELLRANNTRALIAAYEAQGAAVQHAPQCLSLYAQAMAKEGRLDRLARRLAEDLSVARNGESFAPSESDSATSSASLLGKNRRDILNSRDYTMHTNPNDWANVLHSRSNSSNNSSINGLSNNNQNVIPIPVVLSEAFSWSKLGRKMGASLLYAVLLLTGLSVILDQQGIMKSGSMAGNAEVEPNSALQSVTFDDVQGVDEAKQELEEVVQFLKNPEKFTEVGGKLPKGILLFGPPGTGKTYLARAIAGEAGVPFFQMSGSEFDELYVGVGAKRVRELFAAAKKKAPCIVFIDEIDAVGSKRSSKDQSYMRQTLNQLLVELDGFSSNEGVIFIAATNTPESLDKALIRPGRFDRHIPVTLPDVKGRTKILQRHTTSIALEPTVNLTTIARGTPGFSGADLANLVNQAAINASKLSRKSVAMDDLEWAKDRIIMGAERKSAVVTEHAKKLTAYHEGGHTLVAMYTPAAMALHKVTVIPRGSALGVTVQLPDGDKTNYTKRELYAMVDVAMGGRAAEEMIFGKDEVTTGASSDLERATSVAREMILHYGMNEKVGLVAHSSDDFEKLGNDSKNMIEEEVKILLEESYSRAIGILTTHKEELHRLASALVEYETLDSEEIKTVVKGGDISPK